ncbi:MAG: recombination mediator RecR [Chloroflexota bacterium]
MDRLSVPTSRPLTRLIEALHRLPGIGPKMAQRLAYYLLRASAEEVETLAQAMLAVKQQVVLCAVCQNTADTSPCALCQDPSRDGSLVCVVEEPLDVLAIERSGAFKGLYHVLHGSISPMDGVGPEDLKIRELLERLRGEEIKEVILATNPNLEGEATAMYIHRLVAPLGVKASRLARGLPFGGELEYADEVTLSRALEDRHPM